MSEMSFPSALNLMEFSESESIISFYAGAIQSRVDLTGSTKWTLHSPCQENVCKRLHACEEGKYYPVHHPFYLQHKKRPSILCVRVSESNHSCAHLSSSSWSHIDDLNFTMSSKYRNKKAGTYQWRAREAAITTTERPEARLTKLV